jgi:hypothetical protein
VLEQLRVELGRRHADEQPRRGGPLLDDHREPARTIGAVGREVGDAVLVVEQRADTGLVEVDVRAGQRARAGLEHHREPHGGVAVARTGGDRDRPRPGVAQPGGERRGVEIERVAALRAGLLVEQRGEPPALGGPVRRQPHQPRARHHHAVDLRRLDVVGPEPGLGWFLHRGATAQPITAGRGAAR